MKTLIGILCVPLIVLASFVGWLAEVCGCEAVSLYCEGILFEFAGRVIEDDDQGGEE